MKADIWMPLYIGDYLADTARLTTEQHGAYLLLIMDYWRSGKLPDNDQVLAQICKLSPDAWSNAKAMLKHFFFIEDGFWIHKRIEAEMLDASSNKEKRHQRAVKGAAARWNKPKDDASRIAKALLNECPSPSPSSKNITINTYTEIDSKKQKNPKSTRLSPDFSLPNEWIEFCNTERSDLDPIYVFATFKDYWIAKPKDAAKSDWFATWRNWVRRQDIAKTSKPSAEPAWKREQRERMEEFLGKPSRTIDTTAIEITKGELL